MFFKFAGALKAEAGLPSSHAGNDSPEHQTVYLNVSERMQTPLSLRVGLIPPYLLRAR
jgi:hypothetical protein